MKKNKTNYSWIIKITLISGIISLIFSLCSQIIMPNLNAIFGILIIFLFIIIGIVFDMIGVATTSASDKSFHSMASQKVRGASLAVKFIKNSDKVASFCNDVIGDICGIVSGSAGVVVALTISNSLKFNNVVVSLITTAFIASLTIGGKALGKSYAINNNDKIVFKFAKFVSYFYNK